MLVELQRLIIAGKAQDRLFFYSFVILLLFACSIGLVVELYVPSVLLQGIPFKEMELTHHTQLMISVLLYLGEAYTHPRESVYNAITIRVILVYPLLRSKNRNIYTYSTAITTVSHVCFVSLVCRERHN